MVNVATVVQSTLRELSPSGVMLPHPLLATFSLLHKVHRTCRWVRRVRAYSQNCLKVAAGYGLNLCGGDSLLLRVSAVFVMVATRILECVRQQLKLQNSWEKWVDAFRGNYSLPEKIIWNKKASVNFLSESTVSWWRYQGKKLYERIYLILIRTFQLVKNAALLSVRIADAIDDAIEAFSLSPTAVNNGVTEFFLNSSQWAEKLVQNKDLLVEGLAANKKVIETILKGIPTILTADQMIKSAEEALNMVAKIHTNVEKVCKTGDEFLSACASKWGHEFLQGIGLERLLPNNLTPPSKPLWQNVTKKIQRYPSIKKVTKTVALALQTPLSSPVKTSNKTTPTKQLAKDILNLPYNYDEFAKY